MKPRLLLFLSVHRFHAQLYQNGVSPQVHEFSNDPEGREQFASFLQLHRMPALLLTDLIEEDFRHEVIPHLRGKSRQDQLQRKFEQFYRNTPFRQATLQQRQQEGRRDDEMLFSALTNPHLLTPWLDIMLQQQTPLIGIYSVPSISLPLLKSTPENHILLMSWEKNAGLRQTYFNDKQLYLSRLSPIGDSSSFSDVVAAETMRTMQYLKNLSLLPLGETLHAYIICHPNDRQNFEQTLRGADDIYYHYLDIQQIGPQGKSDNAYPDSDATGLLLSLLAAHPPATHYAPPEYTHFYSLSQRRNRLFQLSVLTAAACLLWSMVSLWQGYALNAESDTLGQQSQQLAQRTQQIIQEFPHTLANPADMKSAVTTIRALNTYSPAPQTVWGKLSLTLNDFPRIRVDHLSWQTSTSSSAGSNNSELQGTGMIVSGELENVNGNYRGALDYLDRFQQALKQKGYQVAALTLPLDISPKGSIADNAGGTEEKPALFSLKITWSQP